LCERYAGGRGGVAPSSTTFAHATRRPHALCVPVGMAAAADGPTPEFKDEWWWLHCYKRGTRLSRLLVKTARWGSGTDARALLAMEEVDPGIAFGEPLWAAAWHGNTPVLDAVLADGRALRATMPYKTPALDEVSPWALAVYAAATTGHARALSHLLRAPHAEALRLGHVDLDPLARAGPAGSVHTLKQLLRAGEGVVSDAVLHRAMGLGRSPAALAVLRVESRWRSRRPWVRAAAGAGLP
jgi:hypothetical protein